MFDREDIVRIIHAQGFKVTFSKQANHLDGSVKRRVIAYTRDRRVRRYLGIFDEIAQMNEEQLVALIKQRTAPDAKLPRGFAAILPEQRRRIARLGGQASQRSDHAHRWTTEQAQAAGKIGGAMSRKRRQEVASDDGH